MSRLKRGYTTGVHAAIAFKSALEAFLVTREKSISITNKMDNDDLDVTKGCEIVVTLSDRLEDLELNSLPHQPYRFNSLNIYAGVGVGVVTKDGLKPLKGYPAINPIPLNAIKDIYSSFNHNIEEEIFVTISVTNGEELAKETANEKVGVVGGISILGTTGFVKPISSSAYIDSIKTELNFAKSNGYREVILTLGNSSFAKAKEIYNIEQIVEIGNFVYDSIEIADSIGIKKVIFICGIGKATKVMQGHKNTHNRFGQIDFRLLQKEILREFNVLVDIEKSKTVKGIISGLDRDKFYKLTKDRVDNRIKLWFPTIEIDTLII